MKNYGYVTIIKNYGSIELFLVNAICCCCGGGGCWKK